MNENLLQEIFSVYEVLTDSIKVARRSINKEYIELHNRTVFLGEQKDQMLNKLTGTADELDDIMIVSLFSTFERELRGFIQSIIDNNIIKTTRTIERITSLTTDSIERWTVIDMVDAFSDIVDEKSRGKIKQIYEYRNWVAHGKNPNKLPSAWTDPKTAHLSLVNFILKANQAISPST